MEFDKDYYNFNSQDSDRPALGFYFRVWKKFCQIGPVLEFGCGVGHLARRLSSRSTTFGFEINPYAIEKLSINAPSVKVVGGLDYLPDSILDSIVSLHVLEHIGDEELIAIGKQFSRILKPQGRALVVVPDLGGRASKFKKGRWLGFKDPTHINLKTASEWERLFSTEWGFNVVRSAADGYYDFPYESSVFRRVLWDGARLFRTGLQFITGTLLLRCGDGEAAIFILENKQ